MAIRELTEELFRLRRAVKEQAREIRHLKAQLHAQRNMSPSFYDEEEEMNDFLNGVRRAVESAARSSGEEDGKAVEPERNGDAGALD